MPPEQKPNPDYNFILSGKAPKKTLFGGTKKSRVLVFVAGAGLLLVVIVVIFSFLFSGPPSSTEQLVPITAKQVEIIRLTKTGEEQATSLNTRNYASAIKLSMTSANKQLVTLLASEGRKVSPKELSAAKDTKTDDALTTARQTNKFDEVFIETMKKSILDYQRDVQAVYTSTGSKKERLALESIYNQTRLLPVELK